MTFAFIHGKFFQGNQIEKNTNIRDLIHTHCTFSQFYLVGVTLFDMGKKTFGLKFYNTMEFNKGHSLSGKFRIKRENLYLKTKPYFFFFFSFSFFTRIIAQNCCFYIFYFVRVVD
uniref:Uncharacterized protein n=1 Tax=Cacopsylla melanoneura TaxID=428564 RepID=A0A8D8UHM8_9HEMI